MKINRELMNFFRNQKLLCEGCEIDFIEDSKGYNIFRTSFCISDFAKTKTSHFMSGNIGSRFKGSCIITQHKESYEVIYYDGNERHQIILYPAGIKRVIYKSKKIKS